MPRKPLKVVENNAAEPPLDLFSYAALDRADEVAIREEAATIKARLRRTAEDIVEIGAALIRVKERLPHGQFENWLRAEFEMSLRSANSFIRVASVYGSKSATIADLTPTALYELAAPSTPDEVRAAVEARVAAGELVPASEVRKLREEARAAQERADQAGDLLATAERDKRAAEERARKVETTADQAADAVRMHPHSD